MRALRAVTPVAVLLLVAACGGGGDGQSPDVTETTTTPTATATSSPSTPTPTPTATSVETFELTIVVDDPEEVAADTDPAPGTYEVAAGEHVRVRAPGRGTESLRRWTFSGDGGGGFDPCSPAGGSAPSVCEFDMPNADLTLTAEFSAGGG